MRVLARLPRAKFQKVAYAHALLHALDFGVSMRQSKPRDKHKQNMRDARHELVFCLPHLKCDVTTVAVGNEI